MDFFIVGEPFLKKEKRKNRKRCKNKQGGRIMGTVKEKTYERFIKSIKKSN
jgi:hypothetical protein